MFSECTGAFAEGVGWGKKMGVRVGSVSPDFCVVSTPHSDSM